MFGAPLGASPSNDELPARSPWRCKDPNGASATRSIPVIALSGSIDAAHSAAYLEVAIDAALVEASRTDVRRLLDDLLLDKRASSDKTGADLFQMSGGGRRSLARPKADVGDRQLLADSRSSPDG